MRQLLCQIQFRTLRKLEFMQNLRSTIYDLRSTTYNLKGFTLIELLVVVTVIGILAGLISVNLFGARQRAQDAKKKADLLELKKALLLYNSDFGHYPKTGNGLALNACGPNGDQACPICPTATFAAGGSDGCRNVYAKSLTRSGNYFEFRYYPCNSGDDFRIKINLSNASDPDIADSQARCSACGTTYGPTDYVLCGE